MKVGKDHYRSIWLDNDGQTVRIIDQTRLPHEFIIIGLTTLEQAATSIRDMWVRGAPLIGATAAYGIALAMRQDASDAGLAMAVNVLGATRPTAVNLRWALELRPDCSRPRKPPKIGFHWVSRRQFQTGSQFALRHLR